MSLVAEFRRQPWYPELKLRQPGFERCIEHLESGQGPRYVVETGTARNPGEWALEGQSTLIWDWCVGRLDQLRALSIDLERRHVDVARSQTRHVSYACGDSIQVLQSLDARVLERIRVLYLDSLDFQAENPLDSAFHHFCELAAVWRGLPSGCLVAVDDCHTPEVGKQTMVRLFLERLGIKPAFVGYQSGWVKP
jgi:hypothetical protein